ncbi:hypothetical protein F5883DRAFT_574719 [Diaporthe sp. PMI_573]|nr:hypothetical protein F5883DRAFT_574719 [Diaporthaceae sp. PMI_573]
MQAQQRRHSGSVSFDPSVLVSSIQESLAKLVKATQVVTQEDVVLQRLWFTELGGRERTVEMPHERTFRWLLYREPEEGEQDTEPVTRRTPSSGKTSCSDQNAGSDDDNDAMSFRTAPDGERRDEPDVFAGAGSSISDQIVTPDSVKGSKYNRRVWRAEMEWRNQKRESFLNWLRNGDKVFYCSGKAGSGKSTLMKFLSHDGRTRDELSYWSQAQGKTLIAASFFFWSSGTPLQKRLEGLYRGILWDILRQYPDLIPVVFPTAWSWSPNEVRGSSVTQQPFTMDELESAMNRLFLEEAVTSSYRLCLFLDGLDEYDGDYWKLARAVKSWAESSNDVKFCLSSRPYNAFLRHFAVDDNRHLNLHELTRADMYSFVSDQFRQDERYTAIEDDIREELDLLSAIVDRSDGVFLWVRLVTVELLRGMGDNCSIKQLKRRLESIPDGLENMFQRMLDSIDRTEQQRAAQMFLTMTHDAWSPVVSKLAYVQAILEDLADDSRLDVPLLSGNVGPYLATAACIGKCHATGPRAVARCKGLIEVTHSGRDFPHCHQFSFVHRTVGDFFKDAEITSRLKSAAGDFCRSRRLGHAVLACLQSINPTKALECPDYGSHHRPCPDDTESASSSSSSSSSLPLQGMAVIDPFNLMQPFLGIIRRAEWDGVPSMAMEVDCLISMLRQTAEQYDNGGPTSQFPRPVFCLNDTPGWHWGAIPAQNLQSAVVSHGICAYGMAETAFQLVSRHPSLIELSPGQHHIFLSAALADLYKAYSFGDDISRAGALIEQASSSINTDCSERCKIRLRDDPLSSRKSLGLRFSTWGAFLLALSQLMRLVKPRTPSNLAAISKLLDLFLQNGADPRMIFIGHSFATSTVDMAPTKPKGPLYIDLLDMMMLWRLVPTESTRNILNVARQKEHRGWLRRTLSEFSWAGRQTQDAYEKMSPFDDKVDGEFVPLSVTPYDNLASVSWEVLQENTDWISEQDRNKVEFSFYV